MAREYDVIVIGAGPAGYVAAIRCAQLGLNTVCIDDWLGPDGKPAPGGTCLNAGCIPSKALLESSELYAHAREDFAAHGIRFKGMALDLAAMMERKDQIVRTLNQGILGLLKANGVTLVSGRGKLLPKRTVEVQEAGRKKPQKLSAANIILATGSVHATLAQVPQDGEIIVGSTGALAFDSVPKRLGVIGAGVIGLELGSVWRRLGSDVLLVEAQDSFLSVVDHQIAADAFKHFLQQGLDIRLSARVRECVIKRGKAELVYEDNSGTHRESFDRLIVAVGRHPNSAGLASDDAGLLLDEWGYVHVDEFCATNLPGVWAIGDLVRGPQLAHKGSEEGIMVAERIAGQAAFVDYDTIPSVIYTLPEIAWVGRTEQTLKAQGVEYRAGVFPFAASGRARALGDTRGMVKVLADAQTDRILGVHMLGPHCSELVAEGVIAMAMGASAEDIALTNFAHPSLSEALREAALAVDGRAIHVVSPRKTKP